MSNKNTNLHGSSIVSVGWHRSLVHCLVNWFALWCESQNSISSLSLKLFCSVSEGMRAGMSRGKTKGRWTYCAKLLQYRRSSLAYWTRAEGLIFLITCLARTARVPLWILPASLLVVSTVHWAEKMISEMMQLQAKYRSLSVLFVYATLSDMSAYLYDCVTSQIDEKYQK